MPSFSHRTLYVSLSAIVLVFLTALTLTPRPNLNTLSIPSPFSRSDNHQSPCPNTQPPSQQKTSLSHPEQQQQEQQPTWLLATVSAYFSQRRRNIIRATWQTLYRNPSFDTRFVIAQPPPLWLPLIKHENDTYGDLIILENLEESATVANTVKSIEFLKHLVSSTTTTTTTNSDDDDETSGGSSSSSAPWEFVSKIDDDSFLSASRFYQEFLLPRIPQQSPHHQQRSSAATTTPSPNRTATLIARRLIRPTRPFDTPGGQFYTLSYPLVRLLATTYTSSQPPRTDLAEDVLIGQLLYDANAQFEFVELDDTRAFDISVDDNGDDGGGGGKGDDGAKGGGGGIRRLSKEGVDMGPMDKEALNPHKMKDDEMYLRVAGLFGEEGFVGEAVGEGGSG